MSVVDGLAISEPPRHRARAISAPEWAAVYGMLAPFMANMPLFDANPIGNIIRYAIVGSGFILIGANLKRVTANLRGGEILLLFFFVITVFFEAGNAFATGYVADPYSAAKMILISLDVYLVAKLLDSRAAFERYMALYCTLAFIASIQVVASVLADYFHVRRIMMINVSTIPGEPVLLGMGGLLGTIMGGDFRSCFYFSEAGYFGQFLLPAFAYAFQTKRNWSMAVMALAFIGSLSTAAVPIAALIILIMTVRFGRFKSALVVLAGIAIVAIPVIYLLDHTSLAVFTEQSKTGSYADKASSLIKAYEIFRSHVLGVGMVDLNEFLIFFDPAPGVIMMMLQFGVLQLPLLLIIWGYLFYFGVIRPPDRASAATALGIGAAMGAALILGPIMKYYTIFMLSAVITQIRIVNGERGATRLPQQSG
ncbi:MAG: hypothetical protein V4527_14585 [Pseudomonadota bacterium]